MAREWFLREHGVTIGPLDSCDLSEAAAAGRITASTEVSLDRQKWHKASAIKGLAFRSRLPVIAEATPIHASASPTQSLGTADDQKEDNGLDLPQEKLEQSTEGTREAAEHPTDSPVATSRFEPQARPCGVATRSVGRLGQLAQDPSPAIQTLLKHDRMIMAAGCTAVLASCFLPFASIPIVGRLSYFQYQEGYSFLVFIAAIAGLILTVLNLPKYMLGGTGLCCVVVIYDMIAFVANKRQLLQEVHKDATHNPDNPFAQFGVVLADSLYRSISLEWGGFSILLGGVVAIVGGLAMLARTQAQEGS